MSLGRFLVSYLARMHEWEIGVHNSLTAIRVMAKLKNITGYLGFNSVFSYSSAVILLYCQNPQRKKKIVGYYSIPLTWCDSKSRTCFLAFEQFTFRNKNSRNQLKSI